MKRRYERGNVVTFVVIGLVLLGLLAGGIYLVHRQLTATTTPAETTQVATDNQQKTAESTDTTKTDTQTQQNKDLKDALAAQAQEEKKAADQQKAQQAESSTPSSSLSATSSSNTATNSLPKTGPEDMLVSLLGATLLVGVGTAFVRSRSLA